MASLPKVRDGFLLQQTAEEKSFDSIMIGTADWYTWLENHRSFCFEADACSFTARKEQRPAGWYWYGSRRVHGKLHRAYIGKSAALTPERLDEVAKILEQAEDAGLRRITSPIAAKLLRVSDDGNLSGILVPSWGRWGDDGCRLSFHFVFDDPSAPLRLCKRSSHNQQLSKCLRGQGKDHGIEDLYRQPSSSDSSSSDDHLIN